jgi:DNA repair protein RadA/Sms
MAKKAQISFVCQECGYDTPSWLGKCPECGTWNSLKEIRGVSAPSSGSPISVIADNQPPRTLSQISYTEKQRASSGFSEMDMVLGGGIVAGSAILLAGDPGIGKSTLLLQLSLNIAQDGKKVLYVSGEESVEQIKMRAERLTDNKRQTTNNKKPTSDIRPTTDDNFLLVSLSDVDQAVAQVQNLKPDLVVVDSIQTLSSENAGGLSGSVGQVRYAALALIRTAKTLNIPVVLIGHVTKEGMVAGPMVLSHMVDTVLFLEGEKFTTTRILRSLKNRFGPVDEVGLFQMGEAGMHEVTNPEQLFLTEEIADVPGSVLVATLEGTRAFLVELQALVVYSKLPMPRRVVSGVDGRRVELLLAVLQKHARLPLETYDVFVNVAGGLKLSDPGIDLGICLAVYSSLKNIPLRNSVGIAEVGLLGELRNVPGIEKRVREAEKLGFKNVITAQKHKGLREVLSKFEAHESVESQRSKVKS